MFGIFGGFGWVRSLILVGDFRMVQTSKFVRFFQIFGPFLAAKQVRSSGFLEGFESVQSSVLVGMNLDSNFE